MFSKIATIDNRINISRPFQLHVVRFGGKFEMALLDFGKVIFGDTDSIISWMQSKHLLASRRHCPACQTPMEWQARNDISDGYRYCYGSLLYDMCYTCSLMLIYLPIIISKV